MFDKYPYTNLHELNLDWIIEKVKKVENIVEDFVAYNKITFAGTWDPSIAYPAWSVVEDTSGNGYVSQRPVPVNVPLSDSSYWIPISSYNALYTAFDARISAIESDYVPKTRTINGQSLAANRTINSSQVPYDNTASGLSATNVKTAIDEVAGQTGDINSRISTAFKVRRFVLEPGMTYNFTFSSYTRALVICNGATANNMTMSLVSVAGAGTITQADFPDPTAMAPLLLQPLVLFQRTITNNAYSTNMTFLIFNGDVTLNP